MKLDAVKNKYQGKFPSSEIMGKVLENFLRETAEVGKLEAFSRSEQRMRKSIVKNRLSVTEESRELSHLFWL